MKEVIQNTPIDVATSATVAFIESHVSSGASVLEVGCGSGHVASALTARGYAVVGVESDQAAVSHARALGVDVIEGSWPDVAVEPVNAVVFTRSLHHIVRLPKALAKVRNILLPQGSVLVEDFAYDEASPSALNWFLNTTLSRKGRALISDRSDSLIAKLQQAADPVTAWHEDHDHDLHTFGEMTREIGEHFRIRDSQQVPYLYRYLIPLLPETLEAAEFTSNVHDEESRLGKVGEFSLIGRRILAV